MCLQEEKTYNFAESGNGLAKSRYFVFTARETHNAKVSGREYKLLVPLNFVSLKDNLRGNSNLSNVQNAVRFTRSSREMPNIPGEKILVMHFTNGRTAESVVPRNLTNFLKSISTKLVILTWQAAFDNMNNEFGRLFPNRSLVPTFAYERLPEFQTISMSTVPKHLGYEGTPIMPKDPKRLRNMDIVNGELKAYWPGKEIPHTVKRLQNLSILIECHVFDEACKVPFFLNSPQHRQVLLKVKDLFLAKKDELAGLMNYPDIMYQFMVNSKMLGLRVSANSIAVVTSNPAVSCRTPAPPSVALKVVQPSSLSFPSRISSAAVSATASNLQTANTTWRPPSTTSTVHHFAQTQPSTVHHLGPSQSQAGQSRSGVIVNPAAVQFSSVQMPTRPNSATNSQGGSLLKNILTRPDQPQTTNNVTTGEQRTNDFLVVKKGAQKVKTPFAIFAALQMKKHPPGMPPLKVSDVQSVWNCQTPEVRQKYKVVADQLNQKMQAENNSNVVSTCVVQLQPKTSASVASSTPKQASSSGRGSSWVCPFYPSHCKAASPLADTTALLRHLNDAHFSVSFLP